MEVAEGESAGGSLFASRVRKGNWALAGLNSFKFGRAWLVLAFIRPRQARSSVADYVTSGARTLPWTGLGRMTHSHAPPPVSGGILGRPRLMVGNVDDARRQPSHTDAAISGLRRTACCSLIGTAAAIFTSPAPFLALLACTRYTTLTSSRPHLSGAETPYNNAHTSPLELPALGESAYPAKC